MENIDLDLKQYLKNWADHQPLPVGGRAQLIAAAASLQKNIGKKSPLKISEKSNDLISWAMVYCVDRRTSIARLVT
jgi:hypothetical protein